MSERLYKLLPTIYRQRDAAQGEPLRALLAVIEAELGAVEADIDALYDNWFIETCDEWAVPYIADLLGIADLADPRRAVYSQRTRVARELGYQRRKGRPDTLRQVAQEVSGWTIRVIEYAGLLSRAQHIQHPRLDHGRNATIKGSQLVRLGGILDTSAYRPDVRRIASGRGRHNLGNVGVFVWRMRSYPLTADARQLAEASNPRYTIHPLGVDAPLFSQPDGAEPPEPLDQDRLAADLLTAGPDGASTLYGPKRSLAIYLGDQLMAADALTAAHLADWKAPEGWPADADSVMAVVDVRRGRLLFSKVPSAPVRVMSCYGFSADIGGGPYDRRQNLVSVPAEQLSQVVREVNDTGVELTDALEAAQAKTNVVIEIADSASYELPAVALSAGRSLTIQAANQQRPQLHHPDGLRLSIAAGASLTLSGLLLEDQIEIDGGGTLRLLDCTLPGGLILKDAAAAARKKNAESSAAERAAAPPSSTALQITLIRCITGPLFLPDGSGSLVVSDSIVDCKPLDRSAPSVAADAEHQNYVAIGDTDDDHSGIPTTLERVTIFGRVSVRELRMASETLFTAWVKADRANSGGIRFCTVPEGSSPPRRYRCQPDLALAGIDDPVQHWQITQRLTPSFTSERYGDPGYAQLSITCADELRSGAEEGGEIGAFHLLHQSQRALNLRSVIDEFLPAGAEAGIFYLT